MKRLCLILCLVCGGMSAGDNLAKASDSEIGKWRTFVGVEGGIGFNNYYPNYLVLTYINPLLLTPNSGSAIGYHLGVNLGWQKYLSEIVGVRLSLSFGGQYAPQINIKENGVKIKTFKNGYSWELGFVNDWVFNFAFHKKAKFGILAGIGLDFYDHIDFKNPKFWSANFILLNARLGFSTQIENSIIDLYFSIPALSFISISNKLNGNLYTHYTNTLTLGYKYLF